MTRAFVIAIGLVAALLATLIIFRIDPIAGSKLIFEGAFGDKFGIARTLVRTLPLLLCGLGIMVGWRAGMYNVGGESQYLLGGLTGACVAKLIVSQAPSAVPTMVIFAATIGGRPSHPSLLGCR